MRRIPAALALAMLFVLSSCGSAADVTEYMSLPFSCKAEIVIGSSEYSAYIEKGGADLVKVSVIFPEALEGLTVSLGGGEEVAFRGASVSRGIPGSAARLIYDAFSEANRGAVTAEGETAVVAFRSDFGEGRLRVDAFSAVPVSLETDGVYMEFTDFKR